MNQRWGRGWDFTPEVGLIMGSSWDCRAPCSQGLTKYSKIVERSTDYGQTFQNLSDVPYGGQYGMNGACVVIVDEETVFMAGGRGVAYMTSTLEAWGYPKL